MTMSRDRIRFALGHRYYQPSPTQNGMLDETCVDVMARAFNMGVCEARSLISAARRTGCNIEITCRPSQFARFIVYRYEADECINGVKDLEPQIVRRPRNIYERVADRIDELGTITACSSMEEIVSTVIDVYELDGEHQGTRPSIDVSGRQHDERRRA